MNTIVAPETRYEAKLAELRKTQAALRKTLRTLVLVGLVLPLLFTLFLVFFLPAPVDDDMAALLLADGLLLPLAIGAVIWRRSGCAGRSLRRDIAAGVLRPIPDSMFPHLQQLVRNTQAACGLRDLKLNLLYTRSASMLPSVTRGAAEAYLVIPSGFVTLSASDERVAVAMLAHECAHIVHKDTEFWQAFQAQSTVMVAIFLPLLAVSLPFSFVSAMVGLVAGAPAAVTALGIRISQIRGLFFLRRHLRVGRQLSEELADLFACRTVAGADLLTAIRSLTSEKTRRSVIGPVHPVKAERLKSISDSLVESSESSCLNTPFTPLRVRTRDRLRIALNEIGHRRGRAVGIVAAIFAVIAGAMVLAGQFYGLAIGELRSQSQVILYSKAAADVARLHGNPVLIRMPFVFGTPRMFVALLVGRPGDRVRAQDYRLYVNDRVVMDRSSEKPASDYVPDFARNDEEMKEKWLALSRTRVKTFWEEFWDFFPPPSNWDRSDDLQSNPLIPEALKAMVRLPRQGDAIVLPPDSYFVVGTMGFDDSFDHGLINGRNILGKPLSVLWSYYGTGWSSVILRLNTSVMFAPPPLGDR